MKTRFYNFMTRKISVLSATLLCLLCIGITAYFCGRGCTPSPETITATETSEQIDSLLSAHNAELATGDTLAVDSILKYLAD